VISHVNPRLYRDGDLDALLADRSELLECPERIFVHLLTLLACAEFNVDVVLTAPCDTAELAYPPHAGCTRLARADEGRDFKGSECICWDGLKVYGSGMPRARIRAKVTAHMRGE
jgi:hypothetical protein